LPHLTGTCEKLVPLSFSSSGAVSTAGLSSNPPRTLRTRRRVRNGFQSHIYGGHKEKPCDLCALCGKIKWTTERLHPSTPALL